MNSTLVHPLFKQDTRLTVLTTCTLLQCVISEDEIWNCMLIQDWNLNAFCINEKIWLSHNYLLFWRVEKNLSWLLEIIFFLWRWFSSGLEVWPSTFHLLLNLLTFVLSLHISALSVAIRIDQLSVCLDQPTCAWSLPLSRSSSIECPGWLFWYLTNTCDLQLVAKWLLLRSTHLHPFQ